MKSAFTVLFLLLMVMAAFAGETTVTFNSPTVVNGTKVDPGEYRLQYDIKGNTADVKLIQKNKTVATTTAQVVQNKQKAASTGVVRETNSDGTASLKEIQLGNKKDIIRFENAPAVGK